jgi:hypothetical protein
MILDSYNLMPQHGKAWHPTDSTLGRGMRRLESCGRYQAQRGHLTTGTK